MQTARHRTSLQFWGIIIHQPKLKASVKDSLYESLTVRALFRAWSRFFPNPLPKSFDQISLITCYSQLHKPGTTSVMNSCAKREKKLSPVGCDNSKMPQGIFCSDDYGAMVFRVPVLSQELLAAFYQSSGPVV